MNLPIEKHIDFYNQEITTIRNEWKNYLNKEMRILISEKELFIGRIWSVEKASGLFVIRFKAKEVPRTNTPYFLGLVGNLRIMISDSQMKNNIGPEKVETYQY
jgi:hypothetical protein